MFKHLILPLCLVATEEMDKYGFSPLSGKKSC